MITIHRGDCLEVLRRLDAGSVDAIVTDPPAGIGFMGKDWDSFGANISQVTSYRPVDTRPGRERNVVPPTFLTGRGQTISDSRKARDRFIAFLAERLAECLRVAKPGAVLLCWAIPRTSHWTGTAIEDAGWLIEDRIAHHFGSGFPKHRSKLKPATEDWWLARKPGPKWLGIDASRVPAPEGLTSGGQYWASHGNVYAQDQWTKANMLERKPEHPAGRWPPNLVLSHSDGCVRRGVKRVKGANPIGPNPGSNPSYRNGWNGAPGHDYVDADGLETVADYDCAEGCPVKVLGEQSGTLKSGKAGANGHQRNTGPGVGIYDGGKGLFRTPGDAGQLYGDEGSAARFFPQFDADPFFYTAKASNRERRNGLIWEQDDWPGETLGCQGASRSRLSDRCVIADNFHATVKPLDLMRWLCRLACPPDGVILDPFAGSGSTGAAAVDEGFGFVGIEQDATYEELSYRRIDAARLPLFDEAVVRAAT